MNYIHYVRPDDNGLIVFGFTSGFPEIATPRDGDLILSGQTERHFELNLYNNRGQYRFKVVEEAIQERSQQELDDEWNARPPAPPTTQEQLDELKIVLGDLILFGGV